MEKDRTMSKQYHCGRCGFLGHNKRSCTKFVPFEIGELVCRRGDYEGQRGKVITQSFHRRGFSSTYWIVTVNWEGLCEETLRSDCLEKLQPILDYNRLTPLQKFRKEIKSHDWYHIMNDDHSYVSAGNRHLDVLKELALQCNPKTVDRLWKKHCPWSDETPEAPASWKKA